MRDQYEVSFMMDEGYPEINVVDACEKHTLAKVNKTCLHCPKDGDIGVIVIKSLMDKVEFGRDDNNHKFISMVKKK